MRGYPVTSPSVPILARSALRLAGTHAAADDGGLTREWDGGLETRSYRARGRHRWACAVSRTRVHSLPTS